MRIDNVWQVRPQPAFWPLANSTAAITRRLAARPGGASYTSLWLRQLKRYTRSRSRMFASLGQPLLFLLAFGFGFSGVFRRRAGPGDYITLPSPRRDRHGRHVYRCVFRYRTDLGQAIRLHQGDPVKWRRCARWLVMAGRTAGGATVALIQGFIVILVCALIGFRPQLLSQLPLLLLFMVLVSIMSSRRLERRSPVWWRIFRPSRW